MFFLFRCRVLTSRMIYMFRESERYAQAWDVQDRARIPYIPGTSVSSVKKYFLKTTAK